MAQQINVNEQTKGTLGVNKGGTGGTTSAMARTNLDVPSNSEVVHIAGNETITGTKSFSGGIKAEKITLRDNSIEEYSTDSDSAEIAFNYYGYNTGTTRFRNTTFFNGKGNEIFRVIGSTGKIKYSGDGTYGAGKVLTSDADGNATWQTSSGGSGTFSGASVTTNTIFNNVGVTTISFASEYIDTNSFHNNVTNNSRLTVTTAGIYEIRFSGNLSHPSGSQGVVNILKNGVTTILSRNILLTGTYLYNINMQILQSVSANDYFEVQASEGIYISNGQCNFEIIKLG